MTYTAMTSGDTYVEFVANDNKLIMPLDKVIIIDDNSGLSTIKSTQTRKVLGVLRK